MKNIKLKRLIFLINSQSVLKILMMDTNFLIILIPYYQIIKQHRYQYHLNNIDGTDGRNGKIFMKIGNDILPESHSFSSFSFLGTVRFRE